MAERFGGHEAPARPVELPQVPAGPAQGAVRRTARPTGDRQTPETGPQESAGTTNTASPVPGDQPAVSSRVSSRPEFGDPEGPRRDPVGTVRSHDDGSRAVKVTDRLATHPWCSVTPRGTVWLADEDVAEWGTEREWRFEELSAKLHAYDPDSLIIAIPDNDAENFLELPDCAACEGTGKDDHASPFEAPLAVHFAAPEVEIAGRRRQLCLWCGHVLIDVPLADGQAAWPPWPKASLVRVEDGAATLQPYEFGEPLPPGCCALPDDEPADEPEHCGKHVEGTSSNRCLLQAGHTGDCSDEFETPGCCTACNGTGTVETGYPCEDCYATGHSHPETVSCDGAQAADGPDEAQETRAAADWPAEEVTS